MSLDSRPSRPFQEVDDALRDLDEYMGSLIDGGEEILISSDWLAKAFYIKCDILFSCATDESMHELYGAVPDMDKHSYFMLARFGQLCGLMTSCLKKLEVKMSSGAPKSEFEAFIYPFGYLFSGLKKLVDISGTAQYEHEFKQVIMKEIFAINILYVHLPECMSDDTVFIPRNLLNLSSYPYEQKLLLIRSMFPQDDPRVRTNLVVIDKSHLLDQSFELIYKKSQWDCKMLSIKFEGEVGVGFGVVKEWFVMICHHLFSADLGVFKACGPNRRFLPIAATTQQVEYLGFSGAIIGLAVKYNIQLGILLDRVFFMTLASEGPNVDIEDLKETDSEFYNTYKQMLGMNDENLATMGLKYIEASRDEEDSDVAVTSSNIHSFVKLKIQRDFDLGNISPSFMRSFSASFKNIQGGSGGLACVKFFGVLDLEDVDKLLGGDAKISAEDWEAHTVLEGYVREDDQIKWFWKIVSDMTLEEKINLLLFWTSTRRLPFEGFGRLEKKPKLAKVFSSDAHIPTARTCIPLLFIPPYSTFKVMEERLKFIVNGGFTEGSFGYD